MKTSWFKNIAAAVLAAFTFGFAPSTQAAYTDDCLTFTSAGGFTLSTVKGWNGTLYWSTDKTNWTEWDGTAVSAAQTGGAGDYHLYVYGDANNTMLAGNSAWALTPSGENKVACSGNIETLRGATGDEPSPTSMSSFCYYGLFAGCTSLTTAPALTATTLSAHCYRDMFNGCTSLTTAPALPATTLPMHCYRNMFSGCTSLTTAPALPALDLNGYCYYQMFSGCTSLEAPAMLDRAMTLSGLSCLDMYSGATAMKVYTTPQPGYEKPWVVSAPEQSEWATGMFDGTGGDFTGSPAVGTTYYIKGRGAGAARP